MTPTDLEFIHDRLDTLIAALSRTTKALDKVVTEAEALIRELKGER